MLCRLSPKALPIRKALGHRQGHRGQDSTTLFTQLGYRPSPKARCIPCVSLPW